MIVNVRVQREERKARKRRNELDLCIIPWHPCRKQPVLLKLKGPIDDSLHGLVPSLLSSVHFVPGIGSQVNELSEAIKTKRGLDRRVGLHKIRVKGKGCWWAGSVVGSIEGRSIQRRG